MKQLLASRDLTLSFDDVLINPYFSFIRSRKDVSLEQDFMGHRLDLPVISSNMDTVTGHDMARAMYENGGVGALHRFCTIQENVEMYLMNAGLRQIVSIGLGEAELDRAKALKEVGADAFVIDVAHGAAIAVVNQYDELRDMLGSYGQIMVGNFANADSIEAFNHHSRSKRKPNAFKVGIGGGSMCTTRVVTGCGMPTLASIIDCVKSKYPIVADGGMRNSGDIAKALAAGATTVMLGGILSGTKETPGELLYLKNTPIKFCNGLINWLDHSGTVVQKEIKDIQKDLYKNYRGSASIDSYKVQGKIASHRSAEGEATTVAYKGEVKDVLEQIAGGLKSALSYVGASNLEEFRDFAELIQITGAGIAESRAHGVRK